jgi:hypothetical protein
MSQRQIRARALIEIQDELSGRDRAILGQVGDLRLMSGRQIVAIHFPVSEHDNLSAATRACNRVLRRLVRDRLLVRLERRVGGIRGGSSSFVYALGTIGHRALDAAGARPRLGEPTPAFVLHALAVAQLVVDCTLASRGRQFDLLVCQAEPRCWRQFTNASGRVVLRPDLLLALGVGEYEGRFFLEVDRGTEHFPTVIGKCRLYESYYHSGREQSAHGVSPRTCWIVPSETRARQLRGAIDRDRKLTSQLFMVTTSEKALATLRGASS